MTAAPTGQVDRLTVGSPAALSFTPRDAEGLELTIAAPATVDVFDGAGAAIITAQEATISEDGHALSVALAASALPLLDTYRVEWTAQIGEDERTWETALEIAGGYLFTIAEFRAQRSEFGAYPAATIQNARRLAEDRFEGEVGCAFVPRGQREVLRGDGRDTLILRRVALRAVFSLSIGGESMSPAAIDALEDHEAGMLIRPSGVVWPAGAPIVIHYAHGYDRPAADVTGAALTLAKEYATPGDAIPARAVLQSTEYGSFRLSVAGRDGRTGIPDVDAVIDFYHRKLPAVG